MIVSASYRTDIPAFYGDWFLKRLDAGGCRVVNPYGGAPYTVSLARADVDGFVFWTKNAGPFLRALETVRARGFPFIIHYTVNGYPRLLETSVIDPVAAIGHMRSLAQTYGRRAVVWRYDPIIVGPDLPPAWHRDNFARLADGLAGTVDEVVVSFAQYYRKTQRNMARAGLHWEDPPAADKRRLLRALTTAAAARGMTLSVCSQPEIAAKGTVPARCIDAGRLADVAGASLGARLKGNRPGCGCYESRDIGAYDSCPHGCVYCYAVSSHAVARRRHRAHGVDGEFLVPQG